MIIRIGMWAIGDPIAPLWGLFALGLRFLPYVGAIVAAIFPLIVATAVDPGWSMMLMTAALFLIVEPLIGHVIEPMVYGHSSGLSPVAVVVSATFWTWLWGPIGLILATPLTMCLVVLGRHVERLSFWRFYWAIDPRFRQARVPISVCLLVIQSRRQNRRSLCSKIEH